MNHFIFKICRYNKKKFHCIVILGMKFFKKFMWVLSIWMQIDALLFLEKLLNNLVFSASILFIFGICCQKLPTHKSELKFQNTYYRPWSFKPIIIGIIIEEIKSVYWVQNGLKVILTRLLIFFDNVLYSFRWSGP